LLRSCIFFNNACYILKHVPTFSPAFLFVLNCDLCSAVFVSVANTYFLIVVVSLLNELCACYSVRWYLCKGGKEYTCIFLRATGYICCATNVSTFLTLYFTRNLQAWGKKNASAS